MKPYLILAAAVMAVVGLPLLAAPEADVPPQFDPQQALPPQELTEEQESNRGELESVLRAARDPLDQSAAQAALANWLLAVPTARPATRWLIGVDTAEDRQALAKPARAAQAHLTEAAALLKKADPSSGSDKSRAKKLATNIKSLQAFAAAMIAIDVEGDDAARREAWSAAAAALAESRESENSSLASAANLWQAIAWEQAGRRERALSTLPGGLAKPDYNTDFLARILRCRILSDSGQATAGMSLASQLRARVGEWYQSETAGQRRARQRLIGVLQLMVGQGWKNKLAASTQPANAELLDKLLSGVQQELFPQGDTPPTVFVPGEVIPILVKPPAIKPAATEASEEPATRPIDEPKPGQ